MKERLGKKANILFIQEKLEEEGSPVLIVFPDINFALRLRWGTKKEELDIIAWTEGILGGQRGSLNLFPLPVEIFEQAIEGRALHGLALKKGVSEEQWEKTIRELETKEVNTAPSSQSPWPIISPLKSQQSLKI